MASLQKTPVFDIFGFNFVTKIGFCPRKKAKIKNKDLLTLNTVCLLKGIQ